MAEAALELELSLHPDDAPALRRRLGARRATGTRLAILWHDSPPGDLAADGLALAEHRRGRAVAWRLERLWPEAGSIAPAGAVATMLAQAAEPAALDRKMPAPLLPVAGFDGRVRVIPAAPGIEATLLEGTLRAAAGLHPVCRVTLTGEPASVTALALELAGELRLAVPRTTLAAAAQAVAGRPAATPRLGAPLLPPVLSVGEAFAFVCAHLADVIQHYATRLEAGGDPAGNDEPVHQMRVALRRLGSSIGLFRRAVSCPELDTARTGVKALGTLLAPARDWDVFIAGTGGLAGEKFPADPGVLRLLAAAARRRAAAYAALRVYLAGVEFRRLGIRLAAIALARPWRREAPAEDDKQAGDDKQADALADDLRDYAAHALDRRLRRLLEPDGDIAALPAESLHAIRLRAKRLRYAAELFAPLYPRREAVRFIRLVTRLQERLGQLNDGAVAATLMAELGPAGGRGFAAGVVCGLIAARASGTREKIGRSWRKLRRIEPFWG